MQNNKDSFVFYRSFYDAIEKIHDKELKADIYKAICSLALNEEELEITDDIGLIIMDLIKPQIIANNTRYTNGKKGGRPKTKTSGFEKEKPNENENVNVNVNENENNIYSATELHETDNHDVDDLAIDEYNFGIIWTEYPRKEGKTNAFKYYRKYVGQGKKINGKNVKLTNDQIYNAVVKYANSVKGKESQYIQMGSTFFNTTIVDYVDEE